MMYSKSRIESQAEKSSHVTPRKKERKESLPEENEHLSKK
jgi:hypothetical protein